MLRWERVYIVEHIRTDTQAFFSRGDLICESPA
jgi:hypothetical protein